MLSVGEVGRYEYPDLKLGEAITYAEKIARDFGGKISAGNLAKIFGIEPRGGGFRNRVADLMAYNLIEGQREYKLTKLGTRLSENHNDVEARTQAFLNVPLFKEMHNEFKGKVPDNMNAFTLRLVTLTRADEKEVSIHAARLRNHYNEALPYLMPDIFPLSGESEALTRPAIEAAPHTQSAGTMTIPADYAKLLSDNFIVGVRQDLESMELLSSQIASWIEYWKKKLSKQGTESENAKASKE